MIPNILKHNFFYIKKIYKILTNINIFQSKTLRAFLQSAINVGNIKEDEINVLHHQQQKYYNNFCKDSM